MENEIWEDIADFKGLYQYSNLLRIRSINRTIKSKFRKGKILKVCEHEGDYPLVSLSKNGKLTSLHLHRFFAIRFIPNPQNLPCINHKNGNKNDYSLVNLEWSTYSDNIKHAYKTNLKEAKKGINHPNFGKGGIDFYSNGAKNGRSKKVIHISSQIQYECIKDAAIALNIKHSSLRASLSHRNSERKYGIKYL